ncbi:MAG: hypothetical protein Q7R79_04380 [bacterium]|nr:hypothetical protein [bacterium]
MPELRNRHITITADALKKGVVIMDLQAYQKIAAAAAIPTVQLYGKAAEDLDKLVEEGLKEYYSGKAKEITLSADLD